MQTAILMLHKDRWREQIRELNTLVNQEVNVIHLSQKESIFHDWPRVNHPGYEIYEALSILSLTVSGMLTTPTFAPTKTRNSEKIGRAPLGGNIVI